MSVYYGKHDKNPARKSAYKHAKYHGYLISDTEARKLRRARRELEKQNDIKLKRLERLGTAFLIITAMITMYYTARVIAWVLS